MFKRLFLLAPALAAALVLSPSTAWAQRGAPGRGAQPPGGMAPSGSPIGQPGTPNGPNQGTVYPTQTAPGTGGTWLPNPVFGTGYSPLAPFSPLNPLATGGSAGSGLNPVSPTGGQPLTGPLLNPLATGGNTGLDNRPIQTNPFIYYNYAAPYGYSGFPFTSSTSGTAYPFTYGSGGFYGSTYNPPTMSRASEAITDTPGFVSNVETVMGTGKPSNRVGPPAPGTTPSESSAGEVIIRVPAAAKVWIDGKEWQSSGAQRIFTTPAMLPGQAQTVRVRASWNQEGYDVTRSANVIVQPGDQKSITFMGGSAHE